MNEKAKKYIDLFRQVKIATAATVDAQGHPQARIINVMLAEDDGMYIVTSKGKPFYKQLVETGEIALAAMCPDCQSLKFTGKLRIVDKSWVDKVFEQNPGMNEVYPGESRYILDAFHIYEGHGEWFDLLHYPISRETFSYGGEDEEHNGFEITDQCVGCGKCAEVCPQQCITPGTPYHISWEHCLQCGRCVEHCPADAIRAGIVLAPEDRKKDGLCTKLSIRHNIALPNLDLLCGPLGVVNRQKEDAMCQQAVENLKIKTPGVDIDAGNLSGGNQQKVVVGKWLARNSRVVIFDEPTRGIDVAAKVEIYNLMNQLKEQGIAVMFVSSEMPEVMGIADRIIVMCDGRITGEVMARETTQNEILTLATKFETKVASAAQ